MPRPPGSPDSTAPAPAPDDGTGAGKTDGAGAGMDAAGDATVPARMSDDAPGTGRVARRRKLAALGLVLAVGLAAVVTRAVWAGSRALANGDAAQQRGELVHAVDLWRQAARWYVPGASHVEAAYQRLEKLGSEAEQRGEIEIALAAWSGVRSSILATRSVYLPHGERLAPANERIAALMAARERQGAGEAGQAGAGARDDAAVAWHLERLAPIPGPSVGWSVVALLGFATWLAGGLIFALRGVTSDDRLVPRTAAYAGILVAVGLVIWLLGLSLA